MKGTLRPLLAALACLLVAACGSGPNPSAPVGSPVGEASLGPTIEPSDPPRGPGGWLAETDAMILFLSLSGSDDALKGTVAGGFVPFGHVVQSYSGTVYGSVAKDGTLGLTLDPAPDFAAAGQITGRASGSTLELTYPDSAAKLVTLTFARSDAADYNTGLDALREEEATAQAAEDEAEASAQAEASAAAAAAAIESCTRAVAGHDAMIWAYKDGGDAGPACKAVKSYDIGEGKWASPVQPAASSGSGSLVCVGRLDRSLVFVYDAGGQYYGGLICKSLPLLPYIGVTTTAAADGFGIQIDLDGVGSGSPAAKAGLRERDIIYAADDAAVNTQQDLQYALSQHAPGDSLVLSVSRAGQNLDITVKLGGQL